MISGSITNPDYGAPEGSVRVSIVVDVPEADGHVVLSTLLDAAGAAQGNEPE